MESFTNYISDFDRIFKHDDDGNLQVNTEDVNNFIDTYILVLIFVHNSDPPYFDFIKTHTNNHDKFRLCLDIKERIQYVIIKSTST